MGFRADIPIDDFAKTNPYLAEAFGLEASPSLQPREVLTAPTVSRPVDLETTFYSVPRLVHGGAATRSTSQEMVSWPSVVWDVNGYYHALGVGFRATRRQLLRAYHDRDGQTDEYLTYVFSQLLNTKIRSVYDAQPLGAKLLDRYVEMSLKRRAHQEASRRRQAGETVSPAEVLDEWGFSVPEQGVSSSDEGHFSQVESDDASSSGEVDIPQEPREDIPEAPEERWPYSYYGWKVSVHRDAERDLTIMRAWQEAIAAECQRQRVVVNFAVGLIGHSRLGRIVTLSVECTTVVFISTEHVGSIDELAVQAVQKLISARA